MDLRHLLEIGLSVDHIDSADKVQDKAPDKACAHLSAAYAALLHTPPPPREVLDERAFLGKGTGLPDWELLLDYACSQRGVPVDANTLPEAWCRGSKASSDVSIASVLAALKGVGHTVQAALERDSDAREEFLLQHGPGLAGLMDASGSLLRTLLTEGTASESCRRYTALSVLCILVEVFFQSLWDNLAITGEPKPALLRDLLLCSHLEDVLPAGLNICLKVVFLPAGLNLRNLLLHGFLAPDELPREFFSIVLLALSSVAHFTITRSLLPLNAPQSAMEPQAQALHLPEFIDDAVAQWLRLEPAFDALLLASTKFVPPGHDLLAQTALAEVRAGRALLGTLLLLLVLEQSLRLEFCAWNESPEHGVAQHGAYYSTLDGFGQRNKHQLLLGPTLESTGQRNFLLGELGLGLVHLLSDLFLQDVGPNIRACIVHGKIPKVAELYGPCPSSRPTNAVLLVFLLMCYRRLPQDRAKELGRATTVLMAADNAVSLYRPVFHPDAILAKAFMRSATVIAQFVDLLASRLPLVVDSPDGGKRKFVQPGPQSQIKLECEAALLNESKGSLRVLAAAVRKELLKLGVFESSASGFTVASLASALQEKIVDTEGVQHTKPNDVNVAAKCLVSFSHSEWFARLSLPDFEALSHAVPLYPLLIVLLESVSTLASALADRLRNLETLVVDRTARTRQRKLYVATLLTGPAFAAYLASVMRALEYHINRTLDDVNGGIAEEPLTRVANVTSSLTGMGDDDDNRRGYDSGLQEIAIFLGTRAARIALCGGKLPAKSK